MVYVCVGSSKQRSRRSAKLCKCRYPERKAFWTASSASSLLRRIARAIATNFERDAMNISSNASLPPTSDRVSSRLWVSSLGDGQQVDRTIIFLGMKTGKGLLTTAALARPTKFAVLDV